MGNLFRICKIAYFCFCIFKVNSFLAFIIPTQQKTMVVIEKIWRMVLLIEKMTLRTWHASFVVVVRMSARQIIKKWKHPPIIKLAFPFFLTEEETWAINFNAFSLKWSTYGNKVVYLQTFYLECPKRYHKRSNTSIFYLIKFTYIK